MKQNEHTHTCCGCTHSRRTFMGAMGLAAGAAATPLVPARVMEVLEGETGPARMAGPGGRCVPRLKAAFVRRREHPSWPGLLYDSEAATQRYTQLLREAAAALKVRLDLRPATIHSAQEADAWVAELAAEKPDGVIVFAMDRQPPAWPTVHKVLDTGLPTVVYAPMGTTFIGQVGDAYRRGAFVCSATDFADVIYGMQMLRARAVIRAMRLMVVQGNERREEEVAFYGTGLRMLPETAWREAWEKTPASDAVTAAAQRYIQAATEMAGPSAEDVVNAMRCYVSARRLLEQEECDAVTMNCLGAVGVGMAFPCLAFSRLLDSGVPAICEADMHSCMALILVPQLFDRPGFMFNIVPVTDRGALICSHCTCATRLKGFDQPSVPFHLAPHHFKRDAVPVPHWEPGEKVTVIQTPVGGDPRIIALTGEVMEQVAVPPAGGCVVSPMIHLDGDVDVLDLYGDRGITRRWGHHILFYGNRRRELREFCHLFGLEAIFPQQRA